MEWLRYRHGPRTKTSHVSISMAAIAIAGKN
jgi:hypothetical protein